MQRLCVIKVALPILLAGSRLDFQILVIFTASTHCHIHTHTHTLLNLGSEMTHGVHPLHRCCVFSALLRLSGEGEHILAFSFEGLCSTCPHPSFAFSFASSLSACLPPPLFVTIQPTLFSHTSVVLFCTLQHFVSTVSRRAVAHMLVFLFCLEDHSLERKMAMSTLNSFSFTPYF